VGFERLFRQARARLEREPEALVDARSSLRDPTAEEREAIGGLLGRRLRGASLTVTFSELDEALKTGTGQGLVQWLHELGGPLRDRPAEARAREVAVEAALAAARRSTIAEEPWFEPWLNGLSSGAMARMAGEGRLDRLLQAVTALEQLPGEDVPIALFASDHAGGTKALDGTPLERLMLGAMALRARLPRPDDAASRRALWERFGVVPDDLASQVLVLNLPATGDGVLDQMLRNAAAVGLPLRLTLHQLTRFPPSLAPTLVFVCENPAVLRLAAERLGARCAPLIVTEGRPSTAFWRLLARCSGQVLARADFDKDGLEIAKAILDKTGGRAWRFDARTYRVAPRGETRLSRTLPDTPWDPKLRSIMEGRWRVEEEQLSEILLTDLAE